MVQEMITSHHILRQGTCIVLGIALENAVLDILTDESLLQNCLELLREPHRGLVYTKIGAFGIYPVTLNLHHDDTVSMSVDGPDLNQSRNQSTGIWLGKEELQRVLLEAVQGVSSLE
jgi:hypothetical protein